MDDKTTPAAKPGIDYKKTEDFASAYANNIFLESSLWDLRLIFGELDQQVGPNAVVQHTAITLPWAQVKVFAYFLESHLLAHEMQNGRVQIPSSIINPVPDEAPQDLIKDNPKLPAIHAELKKRYAAFIAANPEAAPLKAKK